ncbi:Mitochondrial substrate carrier family protein [Hibiscus syriacus]|uniref:Mitochondrial substrate carrier family protein n=1 Tax=Hibiscus syriacus TaxID=106335 RepID=A0A6A2Y4V7_HIBSY|nr:Mitochondrial substrate carrier family protein [Hibiscus syriacus]
MEELTEGVNNLNIMDSSPSNKKKNPIATVVTIAEILKNNGLAVEKKITTSIVDMREESGGRPVQKAKIEILQGKSEKFDELMAAAAAEEVLENDACVT